MPPAGSDLQVGLPLILAALPSGNLSERATAVIVFNMGVGSIGYYVMLLFYVPAIYALVRRHEGNEAPWRGVLAASMRCLHVMIGVTILTWMGMMAGLAVFIVPGIALSLNWSLVLPVTVTECVGPITALRRSRALAIGSRGRILLVFLIFGMLLVTASGMMLVARKEAIESVPFVPLLLRIIIESVTALLVAGFQARLYVDLRHAREGASMPALAGVFA